jgi:predicted enzyme related to lactoylglutathione lyase
MGNPFIHVELVTDNVEKAKKFYQGLFDWKYEEMPGERGEAPYNVIKVGDGTGGGIMKKPHCDIPTRWGAYVLVDDVAATLKKAKQLGATILLDETAVGDFGKMGVFKDPDGAVLSLWKIVKMPPKK